LQQLAPGYIELLIDLRKKNYNQHLQNTLEAIRVSGTQAPIWAGIVTPNAANQLAPLTTLADELSDQSISLTGVLALPADYLKSYQPDAKWPTGAFPQDAIAAARKAFPQTLVGGGMLTYFTEVNRCRPDP